MPPKGYVTTCGSCTGCRGKRKCLNPIEQQTSSLPPKSTTSAERAAPTSVASKRIEARRSEKLLEAQAADLAIGVLTNRGGCSDVESDTSKWNTTTTDSLSSLRNPRLGASSSLVHAWLRFGMQIAPPGGPSHPNGLLPEQPPGGLRALSLVAADDEHCDREGVMEQGAATTAEQLTAASQLTARDLHRLQLAVQARTLGSLHGTKCAGDMGALICSADEPALEHPTAGILAWGYARSLVQAVHGEGGPAKKQKKGQPGAFVDLHAEADAISWAARNGVALNGAEAYVTGVPCANCFGLLAGAGIRRVVCCGEIGAVGGPGAGAGKNGARLLRMAEACGIEIVDKVPKPPYQHITAENRVLFRDDLP